MIYPIIGSHSTGKTTLLDALRIKFPKAYFINEVARTCPYPLNENANYKTQSWILDKQIELEGQFSREDLVFSDRGAIDILAYSLWLRQHGKLSSDEYNSIWEKGWAHCQTYPALFYVPIEIKLEPDGVRSLDKAYQKDIDNKIWRFITRLYKQTIILSGTTECRVTKVDEFLSLL